MDRYAACIGSRDLTPEQIATCEKLGEWLVKCGWRISSGNAPGADQAFARGGNRVDPDLIYLSLPWHKFERPAIHIDNHDRTVDDLKDYELDWYTELAKKHHPAWSHLSQGVRKLMIRNGMIMMPELDRTVDLCLAWPSAKKGGGGTGQGMRIALDQKIELIDLSRTNESDLHDLCERLHEEGPT